MYEKIILKMQEDIVELNEKITELTIILKQLTSKEEELNNDILLEQAIKLVVQHKKASASLLQRRLKIGYARAARILDELEEEGVVGIGDGAMPRNVLFKNYDEYLNKTKTQRT